MPKLEAELGRFGLRSDNLADAYTVWWINVWHAAHGVTGDPTQASVKAVKAQSERAMLATPGLAGGDDAGKQAMAEALLLQAVLIGSAAEQAKADPAQLRQIGDAARRSARGFGLDLDAFTLTDAGFVPARSG